MKVMSEVKDQKEIPVIVVADDEPVNRALLQRRLEKGGYKVFLAENGREAIELTQNILPNLVILDVMMPVMDGLEACRRIKESPLTNDIPVIFLSARDETEIKVNGLTLGANDYIIKPFKAEELMARVDVAIRLKRERDRLRKAASEAWHTAEQAQEKALTDALTGLLNRYGLQRAIPRELAHARRYLRPLSCLMIDIDYFKRINDAHGHIVGDTAIQQVGKILVELTRRSDTVFRYGGEEFILLLPETDIEGAAALGEKIRAVAESRIFGDGERIFNLTLSVGAAMLKESESGNDMIARADVALYNAKEKGRNRVEIAAEI
jgi:diguanylate cyclase (GGDEF)-like protein